MKISHISDEKRMSDPLQQTVKSASPASLLAKVYVSLLIVAAIPCLLNALRTTITQTPQSYQWLILTAITLIAVPFFVSLPGGLLVTIGDVFILSICMIYGTSEAVLANALYMTMLMLLLRRSGKNVAQDMLFNIAVSVLNAQIYGLVYELMNPTRSFRLEDLVAPTFAVALTLFLSNSMFVAPYIASRSRGSIQQVLVRNLPTLALGFLVSSSAAGVITAFGQFSLAAPLFAAPCVGAIWAINKVNSAKTIEAEMHLKGWEQLYRQHLHTLQVVLDADSIGPDATHAIRRIRTYALGLAKLCRISDVRELMAIETGALLVSAGKPALDDFVFNDSTSAANYLRGYQERWDGLGHPNGIKGEEIPLGARILSTAIAFDAIKSSQLRKSGGEAIDSIELLRAQAGTLLDPRLVQLFIEHIDEMA